MVKKIVILFVGLSCVNFLAAQDSLLLKKTSNDSYDDSTPVKIINPCSYLNENNFIQKDNPLFTDFCLQIIRNNDFTIVDTTRSVIALLQSVLNNDLNEICFAPFLNLIDSNAIKRTQELCGIHSRIIPSSYSEYCSKKNIQFIVLYYVEFVIIRKTRIAPELAIKSIDITLRNSSKNLNSEGYHKIIQLYIDWFEKGNYGKTKKGVLKNSPYKWHISSQPSAFVRATLPINKNT